MNAFPITIFMRCDRCKKPLRYRKNRIHKVCSKCYSVLKTREIYDKLKNAKKITKKSN